MNKYRSWAGKAFGARQKEFIIILLLLTLQSYIWQMVVSVIPLFARSFGYDEIQIGAISMVAAVTSIISSVPGSLVGQRYGLRFLFIVSQISGAVCALILLNSSSFVHIVISQVSFGISNAFFWPTSLSYLSEITSNDMRTAVIGYSMAISSIAGMFGPGIGGWLIDNRGFGPVFVLYLAIVSAAFLIACALPRSHKGEMQVLTSSTGFAFRFDMLNRPLIKVAILNNYLNGFTIGILDVFFPVFLADLGHSATFIGTVGTVKITGLTFSRFFINSFTKRFTGALVILYGVFLCAFASGIVPLAPFPLLVYVCCLIAGAAHGLVSVFTPAVVAENSDSRERGVAMAFNNMAFSSGRFSSGIGIGWLGGLTGLRASILVGTVVVLAGFAGTLSMYVRSKKVPAEKIYE